MSIRITQQYMYQNMISNMQSGLSKYMGTIDQSSSQKAVNRPSDDPAATYRILTARNAITNTNQYLDSINTAKGWLKLTDDVLSSQVTTTIRSLIGLAEQASTGTYTANNRQQMSFEARELLGQLLNLSNTEFNGNSIFAGHKYDQNAYEMGLALSLPKSMQDVNITANPIGNALANGWNGHAVYGNIEVDGISQNIFGVQKEPYIQLLDTEPLGSYYRYSYNAGMNWTIVRNMNPPWTSNKATFRLPGNIKADVYDYDEPAFAGATDIPTVTVTQPPTISYKIVSRSSPVPLTVAEMAPYTVTKTLSTTVSDLAGSGSFNVRGSSQTSIAFQFLTDNGTSKALEAGNMPLDFRFSSDGGKTWHTGQMTTNDINGDIATVRLTGADSATGVEVDFPTGILIPTVKRDSDFNSELSFFVQNTAFYQGDASDPPPNVMLGTNVNGVTAKAEGDFSGNVLVKVNGIPTTTGYDPVDLTVANKEFEYAYSLDNGVSWVTAKMQTNGTQPLNLTVPGGYLTLEATNAAVQNEVPIGAEFTVHPDRAGLGYEIMQGTYVNVNNVGKDIFGGYWINDAGKQISASWLAHNVNGPVANDKLPESSNLFNIVSNFVTALEFNNQTGCQEALEKLNSALHHITTSAAKTGGLENRVALAYDVQIATRVAQDEVLSSIEDIDLTELLTRLTQYQTAYQTVLMSSSKIMNIGLINYL